MFFWSWEGVALCSTGQRACPVDPWTPCFGRLSPHAVFNLCDGVDVRAIEARVEAYRVANADSIAAVEARHAEEVRRRAAEGEADTVTEALSGTAAAFEGGRDAEPHQGMDYTAQMPSGALAQAGTRWKGGGGRGGAWWGVGMAKAGSVFR